MIMKSVLALATLAAGTFAQSITITAPADGGTVTAGQPFVVEVARRSFTSSAQEVTVVIGVNPCRGQDCSDVASTGAMGTVLYAGAYEPTNHPDTPLGGISFYQDFTLTLPEDIAQGPAVLNVAHLSLVGAILIPTFEEKFITINID